MKKVALLMLVVLVVATMFSGCGSQPSQDNVISGEDVDLNDVSRAFTDQGVYEYIDHVLKTYSRDYVFIDLEELLDKALYYFVYTKLTKDYLVVQYKDLADYIPDAEFEEFSETLDSYLSGWDWVKDDDIAYYTVQYVEDMQNGVDELWGRGLIDVEEILDDLPSEDGLVYLSKKGILINARKYDPTDYSFRENTYYEITEINMEGDTAKVYVKYIVLSADGYGAQTHYALDFSDYRTIGRHIEKNDWSRRYGNASFDEIVSELGIDRKTLGEIEISIKNTSSGPVLNGYKVVDHKNYSSNLVIPDSLTNNVSFRIVMSEAGLNLRTGPGTEYDVITLIPQGVWVNGQGDDGGQEGWLFVSCTLDGTEYFGWVNSEYVAYLD